MARANADLRFWGPDIAAIVQQQRAMRLIVESELSERFMFAGHPDVIFGATWDVPAFYLYSHTLDMLWVYGSAERILQHVVPTGKGDREAVLQRARKLLVTRELKSFQFIGVPHENRNLLPWLLLAGSFLHELNRAGKVVK